MRKGPVAVVGAGLTGSSWAGLFAAHGLEVRLTDADPARLEKGLLAVRDAVAFLVEERLADAAAAEAGLAAFRGEPEIAPAAAGAVFVQEAVREDLETKRAVFRAAAAAAPQALIATSSSGLSITQIQAGLTSAERSLAAHPYNPPHLIPLVELAPGELTSSETLKLAESFYRSVGKEPVVLRRDVPGYIGNRLSAALWREAIELVRTGVATVEEVDRAVRLGPGFRWAAMGPHLVYELGGGESGIAGHLEHLAGIKEGILADIATWTRFPSDIGPLLQEGLADEKCSFPYLGSATLEELGARRDRILASLLRALRQADAL